MFVRVKKGGTKKSPHEYLQLVKNYRKDGKVKQKVIANLGRKDQIAENGNIEKIMKALQKFSESLILIDKDTSSFETTYLLGPILALEAIWNKIDMPKILSEVKSKYSFTYDFEKAVKLMVLNRLIAPKSKLGLEEWKKELFSKDYEEIQLHHIYRSLDVLAKNQDLLQKELYEKQFELFKQEIKIAFYDLTTIYFESDISDDLRRFGYSKDNKTDCTQIVLGLILTNDNIPIGYEIFPGNTYEGNTVKTVIERLKKKYQIEKIIFIGDRGLLSDKILCEIEESGYEYIIGARLSNMKKELQDQIFDKSRYRPVNDDLSISELETKGRRLILGYSKNRARRDKFQREEVIRKLEKKLRQSGKVPMNPFHKSFLKIEEHKVELDASKIALKERRDGFFGYYTNNEDLSEQDVIANYKMLYKIEKSFRSLKSDLSIRPMYHWTKSRIEGHIMMCFLSFYVSQMMQKLLLEKELNISHRRLFEELSKIKVVKMQTEREVLYGRTQISGIAGDSLKAFGSRIPPFILEV